MLEIKSKSRRLIKRQDIALVIIDYVQLKSQGNHRGLPESREIEIAEISRNLNGLGKDLDVPVMDLSQLTRKVEDRPRRRHPGLFFVQNSNIVFFSKTSKRLRVVHIMKS